MNQRLPKSERIRRRVDYLRIQDSGQKIHTPNFVCFSLRKAGSDVDPASPSAPPPTLPTVPARVGITVSRRVGGAVVRNRVKRLVKEAFRLHKGELPSDLELVLIARPSAAAIAFVQAERELLDVARRLATRRRPEPSRQNPSAP